MRNISASAERLLLPDYIRLDHSMMGYQANFIVNQSTRLLAASEMFRHFISASRALHHSATIEAGVLMLVLAAGGVDTDWSIPPWQDFGYHDAGIQLVQDLPALMTNMALHPTLTSGENTSMARSEWDIIPRHRSSQAEMSNSNQSQPC